MIPARHGRAFVESNKRRKIMARIVCPDCALMGINGHVCHEAGCPSSWIDPCMGEGYEQECKWCGSLFVPKDKDQAFCDESCAESYNS